MLYYSVFNCFPNQGLDSVLIFESDKMLCSYTFKCEDGAGSVELINFLYEIEQRKMYHLSRPDAENLILKMEAEKMYQSTKRIMSAFLEVTERELVSLAYRASRNNYIEAVNNLELPDTCGDLLNERMTKKEEANAIFKVVRQVYEQKYALDECLPREFDGLTGETIDLIYKQEG